MTSQSDASGAVMVAVHDPHLVNEPEGVEPPALPGAVIKYMWLPVRRCPVGVSAARKMVRATLADWELSDDVTSDMELLVSEGVSNAVRHGKGRVSLTVEQRKGSLLLRVHDGSPDRPGPGDCDILSEGGRGLWLVAHTADDCGWMFTKDGKFLWCCLSLTPYGPEQTTDTGRGRRASDSSVSVPQWTPPLRRAVLERVLIALPKVRQQPHVPILSLEEVYCTTEAVLAEDESLRSVEIHGLAGRLREYIQQLVTELRTLAGAGLTTFDEAAAEHAVHLSRAELPLTRLMAAEHLRELAAATQGVLFQLVRATPIAHAS